MNPSRFTDIASLQLPSSLILVHILLSDLGFGPRCICRTCFSMEGQVLRCSPHPGHVHWYTIWTWNQNKHRKSLGYIYLICLFQLYFYFIILLHKRHEPGISLPDGRARTVQQKKMHAFQKVTDQVTDGPTNQPTDWLRKFILRLAHKIRRHIHVL